MDADTRELLTESVHELFERRGAEVVAGLEELGWQDVVSDDPVAAIDLLFTEQGKAGQASAALDTVLFDAAGGDLSAPSPADRIYPAFIWNSLPRGIAGLVIAAILAAAMSNLSAALNSLASTVFKPLRSTIQSLSLLHMHLL